MVNSAAKKLIQQEEGFHTDLGNGYVQAYLCPANVWTIGS